MIEKFVKKIQRFGLEHFKLFYGIYAGTVKENEDPNDQGRVKVEVPSVMPTDGEPIPNWARPMFGGMTAGKDKGEYNVPRKGDQVWVMFRNGDLKNPNYVSSGWFADDERPKEFKSTEDRGFKSHSGHIFRFRDKEEDESILIEHTGGSSITIKPDNSLTVETENGDRVNMDNENKITAENNDGSSVIIDGNNITASNPPGSEIKIEEGDISASNPGGSTISMSGPNIEINGPSQVTVKTPSATIDSPSISLGGSATHPVVKGPPFMSYLSTLVTWLSTHNHSPFSPPLAPPPPPTVSSYLSNVTKTQ